MKFLVFSHKYYFRKKKDKKEVKALEGLGMSFGESSFPEKGKMLVIKQPMGIEMEVNSLEDLMKLRKCVDCGLLINPGMICICNEKEKYYETEEES